MCQGNVAQRSSDVSLMEHLRLLLAYAPAMKWWRTLLSKGIN